jgi:hypothetical protein
MIYPELKNYLTQVASPETVKIFDDAIEVLEKYEVPEYMDVFENIVGDESDKDDVAIVDSLLVNLRSILDYLLQMQGVVLNEIALPSQVNAVAEALIDLIGYEDQQALNDCLDSDETTLEKVCVALTLLIPCSAEELMAIVESVDDNFIEVFKQRQISFAGAADPEKAEVVSQIEAYALFKKYCRSTPVWSDKFFENIGSVGLRFEDYVRMYQLENAAELGTWGTEKIAKDLIGLAYLSLDACDAPLIFIRKHLSDLFSDINVATQIDIVVSKITLEINHAKA